jgi:hypothetical protein
MTSSSRTSHHITSPTHLSPLPQASAATRVEMLGFIKRKAKEEPETVVLEDGGGDVQLQHALAAAVGEMAGGVDSMTHDLLDVEATAKVFCRFDNFNDSCVPAATHSPHTLTPHTHPTQSHKQPHSHTHTHSHALTRTHSPFVCALPRLVRTHSG